MQNINFTGFKPKNRISKEETASPALFSKTCKIVPTAPVRKAAGACRIKTLKTLFFQRL